MFINSYIAIHNSKISSPRSKYIRSSSVPPQKQHTRSMRPIYIHLLPLFPHLLYYQTPTSPSSPLLEPSRTPLSIIVSFPLLPLASSLDFYLSTGTSTQAQVSKYLVSITAHPHPHLFPTLPTLVNELGVMIPLLTDQKTLRSGSSDPTSWCSGGDESGSIKRSSVRVREHCKLQHHELVYLWIDK
ncbi:hypothetical protein BDQ12DRAFT_266124 [Crucibulum laeve]|uniref:Uncharacterized protein n=1 Tax=Crucibulum laeve TaxID=68775 RepID=A0A5C3LST9_9AGAR|nr:hypothetical protein BDQ12DRAFT_266124 [Crucibulum laeve]